MGQFQFAIVCLLIFFVVCVLHRLLNKPDPDIDIKAIDIAPKKFFLIFFAFIMLESMLPVFVSGIFLKFKFLQISKSENLLAAVNFVSNSIIVTLAVKLFFSKTVFCRTLKKIRSLNNLIRSSVYNFGVTFPIVLIFSFIWVSCLIFANNKGLNIEFRQQAVIELLKGIDNAWSLVVFILSAIIFVPITEEIIFRGLVYRFLKNRVCCCVASIVTAFVFAYLHFNLLSFVPLFVLSICLSKIYERSADLREPIIVHALFNLINIIAILAKLPNYGPVN